MQNVAGVPCLNLAQEVLRISPCATIVGAKFASTLLTFNCRTIAKCSEKTASYGYGCLPV